MAVVAGRSGPSNPAEGAGEFTEVPAVKAAVSLGRLSLSLDNLARRGLNQDLEEVDQM